MWFFCWTFSGVNEAFVWDLGNFMCFLLVCFRGKRMFFFLVCDVLVFEGRFGVFLMVMGTYLCLLVSLN